MGIEQLKRLSPYSTDTAIYVMIAVFGALQATDVFNHATKQICGVVLAGLVAWKCKRSPGKEEMPAQPTTQTAEA